MTPIQEVQIRLANGDLADCYVEATSVHFASTYQLIQADGNRFTPGRTPPMITAGLAFESLLSAVAGIASARQTQVTTVENPCNDELVTRAQQEATVAKLGLGATVLVNGS